MIVPAHTHEKKEMLRYDSMAPNPRAESCEKRKRKQPFAMLVLITSFTF